jgi:hypothetical protein
MGNAQSDRLEEEHSQQTQEENSQQLELETEDEVSARMWRERAGGQFSIINIWVGSFL